MFRSVKAPSLDRSRLLVAASAHSSRLRKRKMPKTQRVRDPIHNLIEFDGGEFEQACWKLLDTRPMQRLRRIKQLGFSEFVYPGASHSRLAHSIGVFHTARQLAGVVRRRLGDDRFDRNEAQIAVAAALVHDVGHGPFSHAFDDALKKIGIAKEHELRTRAILSLPECLEALDDFPEFPEKISDLIESKFPRNIYASIVSSQFDADRLDYIRRDRLMSGTQQSGIDFDWLLANLHVGKVPVGQDGKFVRKADSLIIHQKAALAAEGYIFSLLYLYINVYYHKTTRGLEKLFSALVELVALRVRSDQVEITGLPPSHPLVTFLRDPEDIERFLALDDSVILGSLSLLAESKDAGITELARRIRDRALYTCIDVSKRMEATFGLPPEGGDGLSTDAERSLEVARRVARVGEMVNERGLLKSGSDGLPGILEDTAPRSPYKRVAESSRRLARIHVIGPDDRLYDLAELSPAVNALGDYKAYRLYARSDSDRHAIESLIEEASR